MAKNRVSGQKRAKYFNRSMLSNGILLFSLSFIALGIEEKALILFGHEIYTAPDWPYIVIGTISAMLSILLLIATFNNQLANKINNIMEGSFSVYYWAVFWFAYTASWMKGIFIMPQGEFIFYLVIYLGTVWFIIITIIYIRSIIKYVKWLRGFSYRIGGK